MLAEVVATPLVENRRINYVLIDHENVQPTDLQLLDREDVRLWVFVGAGQARLSADLAIQMQAMRERADYVRISGNGSNALDFHIAFYIGQLAREDPRGFFHIISRDTGFDPLIEHLKAKKIFACRSTAIAQMPLFKPVVAKAVAASPAVTPEAKPVVKPAVNAVTVIVEKASQQSKPTKMAAAKGMTAAEKLVRMKELLAKAKSGKPGTLAALKKHVASHFQNQLKAEEVDALIAGLTKAGVVKVEGSKVRYA
ncbi:hypothetical protein ARC78_07785 [Stenotrophomonas pictorum JCM 9942]|uniref:PIN-like domain-containing protein n=1 Tax=Stenotrophomonas pictorum JCM 9942 TaxID=1236960 RepID=A0A0R0AMY2_9GAMM|nr:PIN domain-containing protein [Stenotrophomonas pictorum]KRG42878.1 hypothetical protein ARC78_07785 [Stenotrophomonas pictorum JCM 9942]